MAIAFSSVLSMGARPVKALSMRTLMEEMSSQLPNFKASGASANAAVNVAVPLLCRCMSAIRLERGNLEI